MPVTVATTWVMQVRPATRPHGATYSRAPVRRPSSPVDQKYGCIECRPGPAALGAGTAVRSSSGFQLLHAPASIACRGKIELALEGTVEGGLRLVAHVQ